MAFTDFKQISDVQEAYNIRYETRLSICVPLQFEPSASFVEEFEQISKLTNVYASEQMRKQAVIWPMLSNVYRTHAQHLTIWSEETISVPDDTKLAGAPDY